jgi:AcrR family transcriptional regulator
MPPAPQGIANPDRRRELVLAAYHQVAARGFEGLRTREVAAEAGVNIATLHYYFPTKEMLIQGVLAHAMDRFRSTMDLGGDSTDDLLRSHFDGLRRLRVEEPQLFAVMGELALRSSRDPAIRALYERTTRVWRQTIRGLLLRAAGEGSMPAPRDPDATAALVVSAVTGASMVPADPELFDQTLQELQRSLGLGPGPAPL